MNIFKLLREIIFQLRLANATLLELKNGNEELIVLEYTKQNEEGKQNVQ